MRTAPKYDYLEAVTRCATRAYELLDGEYTAEEVLAETLRVNRILDASGFIVALAEEIGAEQYAKIIDRISGTEPNEA